MFRYPNQTCSMFSLTLPYETTNIKIKLFKINCFQSYRDHSISNTHVNTSATDLNPENLCRKEEEKTSMTRLFTKKDLYMYTLNHFLLKNSICHIEVDIVKF